jgi:acyl-CoA-binding protein
MALKEDFEKASVDVKSLTKRPSNEQLLSLYAFFKQATEGDVKGSRPGMFDLKGRAKYDSWAEKKGMAAERAMQEYVTLVQQLQQQLG